MEDKIKILWADDEIELLKPHVLFLEEKGYEVASVTNGRDALDQIESSHYDIVFLDENMPGLSGLETLNKIKTSHPQLPIIMITKNEEEAIMEDAIGSKISDYLIKPVNPRQILLSIKKNLDTRRLVSERSTTNYQQAFSQIGMALNDARDWEGWTEIYRQLCFWSLELDNKDNKEMHEVLNMQRTEANQLFSRWVEKQYEDWVQLAEGPMMSHQVLKTSVFPKLEEHKSLFLVVIDNLRYDQWMTIKPIIGERFRIEDEQLYCSILPSATQYARNALFAGLLPADIAQLHPKLWKNESDEGSKNAHEEALLQSQIDRLRLSHSMSYHKITHLEAGKKLVAQLHNLQEYKLNVVVYNFVDMLSHARTEMEVLKELASDEAAYRSLTRSWFAHSPLAEIIDFIAQEGHGLIITTDHGTIPVKNPVKVVGNKATNPNIRYKVSEQLQFEEKQVYHVPDPASVGLPKSGFQTRYVFAKAQDYLVYPNNYNHFVNYYRDTFQHGGISMEEMIVPIAYLKPK